MVCGSRGGGVCLVGGRVVRDEYSVTKVLSLVHDRRSGRRQPEPSPALSGWQFSRYGKSG
jgi:hypothetical protein